MTDKELYNAAEEAMTFSYSPYSHYRVGAALIAADDNGTEQMFTGCNVENASYGGCICAERTAAVKAVSSGFPHLRRIAVAGGVSDPDDMVMPCGICRQFLCELADEGFDVILKDGCDVKCTAFSDLMPYPFVL